jgi:hypothetical protein
MRNGCGDHRFLGVVFVVRVGLPVKKRMRWLMKCFISGTRLAMSHFPRYGNFLIGGNPYRKKLDK